MDGGRAPSKLAWRNDCFDSHEQRYDDLQQYVEDSDASDNNHRQLYYQPYGVTHAGL